MAHGGKRAGSGRKSGSLTVKNREIAERVLANGGLTPLEVILDNMRFYHQASVHLVAKLLEQGAPPPMGEPAPDANPNQNVVDALREVLGFRKMAGEAAKEAAPYLHPRLSSVVEDDGEGEETVPLADRLDAYRRRDDLKAAGANVVDLTARKDG